jgi:hypothetical protein
VDGKKEHITTPITNNERNSIKANQHDKSFKKSFNSSIKTPKVFAKFILYIL